MKRLCQLVVIGILLIAAMPVKADETLSQALQRLDQMRNGDGTDFEAIDRLGMELLETHTQPQDRGRIYYQLAHTHAQSGMKHPDKIQEYAEAALDTKLVTPEQRGTLYSYLSSAHEVDLAVKEFEERRKNALRPLLTGLAELKGFDLPELPPELPVVPLFEGDFIDRAAAEKARRDAEEAIRRRRDVQRTRALVARRETLKNQVKWLYAREPAADGELLELAEKTIGEREAEDLVGMVRIERERRLNQ